MLLANTKIQRKTVPFNLTLHVELSECKAKRNIENYETHFLGKVKDTK